jgi:hypothetical protein
MWVTSTLVEFKSPFLEGKTRSSLAHKYWTRVEMTVNDNHTNSLQYRMDYGRKKFYTIGSGATTLSIMAPSITTPSITTNKARPRYNDVHYDDSVVIMLISLC